MDIDEIRGAFNAAGLERLADHVERLTSTSVRVETRKVRETSLLVGASKIGGQPDMPAGAGWPKRDGRPLGFLAQFNLSEVAAFDLGRVLPSTGLLSFFYDFQAAPWGLKVEDRGGWRVLYADSITTSMARLDWPDSLPEWFRLPAQRPAFSLQLSFTAEPEWVLAQGQLTGDELAKYRDVVASLAHVALDSREGEDEEVGNEDENADEEDVDLDAFECLATQHKLLGHPTLVHYGRMPWECESLAGKRATPNFESLCFKPDSALDERVREDIRQAFERWCLLFQLGNVSGLPFPKGYEDEDDPVWRLCELCDLWARGGLMYFWIERDRLTRRDLSNVWLLGASQL